MTKVTQTMVDQTKKYPCGEPLFPFEQKKRYPHGGTKMTVCRGHVGQMHHLPSFFFFIVNKKQSIDLNKKSRVHDSAAKCNGANLWQHVLKRLK